MKTSANDRDRLRRLAGLVAEVAAMPSQQQHADLWRRLNRLEPIKPPVWVNEICWNEMGREVALECEAEFCRSYERQLLQVLYQWQHLPGDMVVDGYIACPIVVHDSGFGLDPRQVLPDREFGAKDYLPSINGASDLARIHAPEVWVDWEATEHNFEQLQGVFAGVLPVLKEGRRSYWFSPWDMLVCSWGTNELMTDMMDRPELVEMGAERMVEALIGQLEQEQALGVLSLNNNNVRVGSGGLGFSDQLPQPDFDGVHVRPMDLWGTATPQIFSEVSPAMHERFALRYELRWLERFGLNCYGCCEPLHKKIGMLAQVPRLRRISISPRANVAEAAEAIGDRYILSLKPNPAILAEDRWSPEAARADLRGLLDRARGCVTEVILKDISTLRGEPRRLWEWAEIASQVTEEYV